MRARELSGSALLAARHTLRQPRYARFFAVMLVVAIVCIGAGTWQILRFDEKVHDNDALTRNARIAAAPVASVLPLVGSPAPSRDAVRYRTVTATGTYRADEQVLVRLRSIAGGDDDSNDSGGKQGFYVLTPFATEKAMLLVVRGFVAAQPDGDAPATVTAPPRATVTVRARVETAESGTERPKGIPAGQVSKISPTAQAARLGTSVYNGYVELLARQPGTAGLTALPAPDLSNPAGGAVEPQHFAYIIQWYLFAALALAAPFAMARAERREHEQDRDDEDPFARPAPVAPEPISDDERRAAKIADRYGR